MVLVTDGPPKHKLRLSCLPQNLLKQQPIYRFTSYMIQALSRLIIIMVQSGEMGYKAPERLIIVQVAEYNDEIHAEFSWRLTGQYLER